MKQVIYLFLLTLSMISCGNDRPSIDVSKSKLEDVKIQRFDIDFYNTDTNNVNANLNKLKDKYGNFVDLYLHRILGIQPMYSDSEMVGNFSPTLHTMRFMATARRSTRMFQTLKNNSQVLSNASTHCILN